MACSDFGHWSAVRDSMPGDNGPTLRIDGKCTCTSTGHTLTLEPDNEGIVDDPDMQVFRLIVQEPKAGGGMVTEEPIHYEGPADLRAKKVVVRLPDGQEARIDIQEVS